MKYRFLGPTGIQVSVISFGNWVNSNTPEAEQRSIDCVKLAWDLGINYFDTAQMYGYGEAEIQFGKALKALNVPRHKFVLSTKIFWGKKTINPTTRGLSRKHIIQGLRNSLKRLDYPYVDIVFCHRPDDDVPMEQICRAYDWAVRQGWTFYWGTSQWTATHLAEAFMVCEKYNLVKPVVEQCQYNLFTRNKMEEDYRCLLEKGVLGTTVFSPLAGGVLTGKYNNGIPEGSRFDTNPDLIRIFNRFFSEEAKENTLQALKKFQTIAERLNCTMAQLAMAWVIVNPDVSTAITGCTRPQQLQDTIKALEVVEKLTLEIQREIEDAFGTAPNSRFNSRDFGTFKSRRVEKLKY